jgi:flagellar hook assembly protein FlgD
MRLSFALARPEHVRLEVFDLAGRAVRRLADEALPAGPTARVWDGTDDRGAAVAPGRYWARLTAGSRVENLGVLRIR